jgi:hypothetical protein
MQTVSYKSTRVRLLSNAQDDKLRVKQLIFNKTLSNLKSKLDYWKMRGNITLVVLWMTMIWRNVTQNSWIGTSHQSFHAILLIIVTLKISMIGLNERYIKICARLNKTKPYICWKAMYQKYDALGLIIPLREIH